VVVGGGEVGEEEAGVGEVEAGASAGREAQPDKVIVSANPSAIFLIQREKIILAGSPLEGGGRCPPAPREERASAPART
jgi:hypothetical protein